MNKHLQNIIKAIEQNERLTAEEKADLIKSAKEADKELEITAFKLDRTEKVKRTTAVLLEETIAELEQKRKAVEEQNRELEIESALEKVRGSAMAMHDSNDISATTSIVFSELKKLGIQSIRCGVGLLSKDSYMAPIYAATRSSDGEFHTLKRNTDMTEHSALAQQYETWLKQENYQTVLSGEELRSYYNLPFFHSSASYVPPEHYDHKEYGYYIPFTEGLFYAWTEKPYSEDEQNILNRFKTIIALTFRRYLDLQKAEAQAREAHIEASLERVRAKTMAMHKSSDMLEVVKTLGEQFELLGFKFNSVNFNTDTHEKDWHLWLYNVGSAMYPGKIHVPYIDHPCFNRPTEAFKKGGDLHSFIFTKEEKDSFFDHIYTNTVAKYGSDERKRLTYAAPGFAMSTAVTKNTRITIANFKGEPFSEDENAILRRFANVFEQSYTRFLDLQKAEAQAREAEIELGLERVRARAMAMQNSSELSQLVDTVFKELTKLDFALTWCIINIIDEPSMSNTVWAANPDINKAPESYHMLFEDYPFHHAMMKGWKERNAKCVYTLEGTEKKVYDEYLFKETEFRKVPEEAQAASRAMEKYVVSFSFSNFGGLQTVGDAPLSDANLDILSRFGKVFDLTYTRFNDLKQAEAQARESQIQLALERVRARTMAMQKSDELPDAANLLFLQVQAMGMPAWSAGYCTWDDDKKSSITLSMSSEGVLQPKLSMPLTEDPSLMHFREAWERGESFFVEEVGGEELKRHYAYLRTLPGVKETLDDIEKAGFPVPTFQIFHLAYFTKGFLLFITYEPVPESHDIFKRFAKVFEQTYTRFLDLQKAEAQTREAKIEAALEKVRSRTMAMQRSAELAEVATVLFQQVKALGVQQWTCGFSIFEIDDKEFTWYPGGPGGEILPPCKIPLTDHPVFISFNESRKRGDELYIYEKTGEEQADHYRYMCSLPVIGEYMQSRLDAGEAIPAFQIDHLANFSHGNLIFITYEHFPEMHDVFKRFAKVFDQTYTRFLDLQKAEAQAREAQIEAALERVRSRTMGMQKSEELREVIQVIYEQMVGLNIQIDSAGFDLEFRESNDWNIWHADAYTPFPNKIHVPYFNHPFTNAIIEAKNKGVEFLTFNHSIEDRNKILDQVFKYAPASPEAQETLYNTPGLAESHVYLKNVFLYISNYAGIPYTDAENAILIRFGKVFEQTYTRFKDLEKAEAQAREVVKQASVDRVRAEIASMRTTNDLERIQPLLWNELTTLGVPFIRCGVFIMDEEQQQVQSFLSTPDGKSIAAFRQPYNSPGEIAQIVEHWHQKKIYKQHWNEAQFIEFTKNLVQQGAITSGEKYITENRPTDLYLHFLPFLQGMLYAGSTTALSDDELQLVQNLADAFATAYSRYEDFNKLELAKEQIEKTLVDLKQTQAQLVQSEKMASLGELTAGIAHEIQNPLNFVNNFSDVNKELLVEMKEEIDKGNIEEVKAIADDIISNEEKINHHGKRADAIVKGMLQHSRSSSGIKEPTDINVLADEYLRLAYHGLRAKDKFFNATMKTDFDNRIDKVNIIPQEIGRVILNLITNAFYVVAEKKKQLQNEYEPTVTVTTKKEGDKVFVSVKDNGNGIPQKILDKIFQPFFTTKPTGQGTGLGLSLSYDIVKAHSGEIKVETNEGEGTEFIIQLPIGQ